MVGSWVSSHESEVDVIVYIVYTAVLLSSSVLNCTVQCPYVVIGEVDYVLYRARVIKMAFPPTPMFT